MLNVYKNSVCFYFWGVWQGQIYFTISDFYTIKSWEPGMRTENDNIQGNQQKVRSSTLNLMISKHWKNVYFT